MVSVHVNRAKRARSKGREQREAVESIQRASQAYESARTAILEGRSWDAQRTLRRIGERVALGAAKAARACALGQTSLTALASEQEAPEAKRTRRKSGKGSGARRSRKGNSRPAAVATTSGNGNSSSCGVCPTEQPAEPPEADAAKDKALMDAFSQAIAAALGGEAA